MYTVVQVDGKIRGRLTNIPFDTPGAEIEELARQNIGVAPHLEGRKIKRFILLSENRLVNIITEPEEVVQEIVRLVMVQFHLKNERAVPRLVQELIGWRNYETTEERDARCERSGSGTQAIETISNVSLDKFLVDIKLAGLEPIDAFCELRNKGEYNTKYCSKQIYRPIVRFVFVHRDDVRNRDKQEFIWWQDDICEAFTEMCETALWQTEAWLNPCFREGVEVEGLLTASVNLNTRTPLLKPDGTPEMRRQKDENGKRRFDVPPLPLQPACYLVWKDDISLTNGFVDEYDDCDDEYDDCDG